MSCKTSKNNRGRTVTSDSLLLEKILTKTFKDYHKSY